MEDENRLDTNTPDASNLPAEEENQLDTNTPNASILPAEEENQLDTNTSDASILPAEDENQLDTNTPDASILPAEDESRLDTNTPDASILPAEEENQLDTNTLNASILPAEEENQLDTNTPNASDLPAEEESRLDTNTPDASILPAEDESRLDIDTPDASNLPAEEEKPLVIHTLGVSNLHKKFGKKEVVRGVDFSIQNGVVAGLLGPNGAGKTTIFYMIVGFYTPTEGIVLMNNVDITSKPMYRRARLGIAYLPQEASIFRKLTVEQNIWAILESRRDIGSDVKKEKLDYLLDEFGIDRIRKQYGYTLSGGERRRTEIARALATEPKFLLLDEPFAGIDPIAVYEIKQIIRQLAQKGIGILITDHNVRDTLEITNEAFIIADGTIVAHGDREDILNDEMVRKVYLGSEFKM